jgi:hypothetical protein
MIQKSIIYKTVIDGVITAASNARTARRNVRVARKAGHKAFVGIGHPTETQIGRKWA